MKGEENMIERIIGTCATLKRRFATRVNDGFLTLTVAQKEHFVARYSFAAFWGHKANRYLIKLVEEMYKGSFFS